MIEFRPFLNSDPPALVRVWTSQPVEQGLMQPLSNTLLEMFVLAKPYFDREGLIIATDEGQVAGFAHAGFGPSLDRREISHEHGILCVLLTLPHPRRRDLLEGLVERCERYLKSHAARWVHVGAAFPQSPFYLGLCGGSDLPGVRAGDIELEQLFRARGYEEYNRSLVMQHLLAQHRVPVDRVQLQHKRNYRVHCLVNPPDATWWDACVFGPTDRLRFFLESRQGGTPIGVATFWDMGPLSTRSYGGGMGMIDVHIDPAYRRQGLGTYFVAEALRQLQSSGIQRVETQVAVGNDAAHRLLQRIGFTPLTQGVHFARAFA